MQNNPILVTGGTGTLGKLVVPRLQAAGHDVRVLSRHARPAGDDIEYVAVDLLTGDGIDPAVRGVETILHLAGGPKGDDKATANLVKAASKAGVGHIVLISVIGAGDVPLGYMNAKHGAERALAESGIPWTTLRAAQFHDLTLTIVKGLSRMPVVPIPGGMRLQPVDADEVAARLVELTLDRPAGRVADLAGPKVYGLKELVRGYLTATGKHRLTMGVRFPGKAGRAYRADNNLNLTTASRGKRTWEEFLAERVKRA